MATWLTDYTVFIVGSVTAIAVTMILLVFNASNESVAEPTLTPKVEFVESPIDNDLWVQIETQTGNRFFFRYKNLTAILDATDDDRMRTELSIGGTKFYTKWPREQFQQAEDRYLESRIKE